MNNSPLNVLVGSTNSHELEAVGMACRNIGINAIVTGIATQSGQNEQPYGLDEGYEGAYARALAVYQQNPEAVAIGMEIFVVTFDQRRGAPKTLDMAFIVILLHRYPTIITTSSGIIFPEEYLEEAFDYGLKETTVGSMIAKRHGGDGTDPHAILTGGKVTRQMTLVSALESALRQLPDQIETIGG